MKNTDNQFNKNDSQKVGGRNSDKITFDLKKGFHNVFLDELKDIYLSEKAILKIMPTLIENADSEDRTEALNKQLEFTQKHIIRLEDTFYSLGESDIILKPET